MKLSATACVLLLLAAQDCSAARLLLTGAGETPPVVPPPTKVEAGAKGSVVSDTKGSVVAGSSATLAGGGQTVSSAKAEGEGKNVLTNVEVFGKTPTSQGSLKTSGAAGGAGGAKVTSIGQVLTDANSASSAGFTNLRAAGLGSFIAGSIQGSAKSKYGTSTFQSTTDGTSNTGVQGEVAGVARSNLADLLAQALSIVANENLSASSSSTVTVNNPTATNTAAAQADTIVAPTSGQATGQGSFTGSGQSQVVTSVSQSSP